MEHIWFSSERSTRSMDEKHRHGHMTSGWEHDVIFISGPREVTILIYEQFMLRIIGVTQKKTIETMFGIYR